MRLSGKQAFSFLVVSILYILFMTSFSSKEMSRNLTVVFCAIFITES